MYTDLLFTWFSYVYWYVSCFMGVYFQIGDRVIAVPDFQAWADVVVLPAHHVFKIPTGNIRQLSFV